MVTSKVSHSKPFSSLNYVEDTLGLLLTSVSGQDLTISACLILNLPSIISVT